MYSGLIPSGLAAFPFFNRLILSLISTSEKSASSLDRGPCLLRCLAALTTSLLVLLFDFLPLILAYWSIKAFALAAGVIRHLPLYSRAFPFSSATSPLRPLTTL